MTRALNWLKEHPEAAWLAGIILLSTLLRLAFLHEPFERDEGQYATIAQTILRGGLPYRDAVEIKPPGIFYLYALAIALFGASTEAVRIFTALYAMLTLVSVYGVARQTAGVRAGLWATLVCGFFSPFPYLQGGGCNAEVFLVFPMLAGIWFLLQAAETGERRFLCWCGLCGALAMLIKQVALPLLAVEFLLVCFLKRGKGGVRSSLLDLAAFLLPMALCALGVMGYFYLRGGLADLLYWTVEFPRNYKASEAGGPSLGIALRLVATALMVPALLGIPSALWLAVSRRDIAGRLPLLAIVAACLSVALPGKYFPHYFITLVPFLAVPAGIGLERVTRMARAPAFLALLLVSSVFALCVWDNYKYFVVLTPQEVSVGKYGTTDFVDSVVVARYLRENSRPEDYIFVWGFQPQLYFLADRRCSNPFLVSLVPGWSKNPGEASRRLMQSLVETRPAFIVFQPEWSKFAGEQEVLDYIGKNCSADYNIPSGVIYKCSSK